MKLRNSQTARLFAAEAAYAESIFRDAIGDAASSLAALREALTLKPDYAPAILSIGSVEYQVVGSLVVLGPATLALLVEYSRGRLRL